MLPAWHTLQRSRTGTSKTYVSAFQVHACSLARFLVTGTEILTRTLFRGTQPCSAMSWTQTAHAGNACAVRADRAVLKTAGDKEQEQRSTTSTQSRSSTQNFPESMSGGWLVRALQAAMRSRAQ